MVTKTEAEIKQAMERINWDFDDYSSTKYPLDLNSIPWYPATFPAPLPKYLIALLSEPEDIVFDPFGGKGTAAVETLKQRRKFVYNDLNPHAVQIMQCVLDAIRQPDDEEVLYRVIDTDKDYLSAENNTNEYPSYSGQKEECVLPKLPDGFLAQLSERGINHDAIYWYHSETLKELLSIYDHINQYEDSEKSVRKLAFLSILKVVSSQRGHFSYVTDNCKPAELKYYNAVIAYLDMLDRIQRACVDFKRQYKVLNRIGDINAVSQQSIIRQGDARNCTFLLDDSVDLIITSPPYLCAQDYVLTMRLNNFFFPDEGFTNLPFTEIGPRRLRTRPGIVDAYFNDMSLVLNEMFRVLKCNAYFCFVIGQGKGKISENLDIIGRVQKNAEEIGFSLVYKKTRNISFRTNRVGGVDKEDIVLFRK